MSYYIYEHWLDGKCIYVGSGTYERAHHLWRNKEYNDFVKDKRDKIIVKIFDTVETKEESIEVEKARTLEMMKDYDLFNIFIANNMTIKTKEKISKTLKGKKLTKARKEKISTTLTGYTYSKERNRKISKSHLKRNEKYICVNINGKIFEFKNKKTFLEEFLNNYDFSSKTLYRGTSIKYSYPKKLLKGKVYIIMDDFLETFEKGKGNIL